MSEPSREANKAREIARLWIPESDPNRGTRINLCARAIEEHTARAVEEVKQDLTFMTHKLRHSNNLGQKVQAKLEAERQKVAELEKERDELKAKVEKLEKNQALPALERLHASAKKVVELKADNERLREAAKPLVHFINQLESKPMRGIDDEFYGIHCGSEFEAFISFSMLRKLREAIAEGGEE